jgi:hypothetical protein
MPVKLFEFAIDTERSFYEVTAETEAEARKRLYDNPEKYYRGCHHDTVDDENSYELIYVTDDYVPEDEDVD